VNPEVIFTAVTPTTAIATTCVALLFASYLWHVYERVVPVLLLTIWLGTVTFILICGAARFADGSPIWETYIGVAGLWTWFIIVASTALHAWRVIRKKGYFER
jgi:hypothetical protein